MFTNPICHWAGGEPTPLFEEDFRNAARGWDTPDGKMPITTSWFTDKGLSAPSHIYDFELASGVEPDHVGGSHLYEADGPLRGEVAWGIGNGRNNWGWKKCVETQFGTEARMETATVNDLNFDVGESWTILVVVQFRAQNAASGGTLSHQILSNYDGSNGYALYSQSNHYYSYFNSSLSGAYTLDCANGDRWMEWTCSIFGVNHVDSRQKFRWPWGWTQRGPTGVPGAYNGTTRFRFGGGTATGASRTSSIARIAYMAVWRGAAAEALADYDDLMTQFWMIPQYECPGAHRMQEQGGSGHAGVIVNEPGQDVRLRNSGPYGIAYHYSPGFSHAGKVGALFFGYGNKYFTNTERFDNWDTYSNLTDSYANADLDESPMGMRLGWKLTATADNAYMRQFSNAGATTGYHGIFYKRHSSMAVNVPWHFRYWNRTTLVHDVDLALTATDKWQWIEFEATYANDGDVEIGIDTNGDSLAVYRVYGSADKPDMTRWGNNVTISYALGAMPSIEAWIKAAQGEIEITYVHITHDGGDRCLFDTDDDAGTDDLDSRLIESSAGEAPRCEVYNGAGGLDHQITGPVQVDWKDVEHKIIFQWDYSSPRFEGRYSRMYFDGVKYPGAVAPWAISGTELERLWLGYANELSSARQGNCIISRVRVWEFPWR